MGKSRISFAQNLSGSYKYAPVIGNSVNLAEMLCQVIHTIVRRTSAAYGIIWVKNGEEELLPATGAGIRIGDTLPHERIISMGSVFKQMLQGEVFVLRKRDDEDFSQYLGIQTGKEEAALIVPVGNVAILHLVYAGRVDETLGNMLAGLSPRLNVAIDACLAHENIIKEIWVREETENELMRKTDEVISGQKEFQRLYAESEEARRSLLSILEDVTEKENAFRKPEGKYRSLIEQSQDISYLLYEGKFELINKRFEEFLGYTLEEVNAPDFHFMNLVAPRSRDILEERTEKAARGEAVSPRYEFTALTRDGVEIEVETSISYIPYKEGIAVQGVMRDITQRKRAERTIDHLNLVLRAIRNVNQLITREKDRDKLIKGVCEILVETRGYDHSWVAIWDESGRLVMQAEVGFGEGFLPFADNLRRGGLPICVQKALENSDVVVQRVSSSECAGCPIAKIYPGRTGVKARLAHAGKVYGVLSASFYKDIDIGLEEQALFSEVADDIALALHDIELKEEHRRADELLQASEGKHRIILENIEEGYYEIDIAGNFTFFNDSLCKILGYPADELLGMNNRQYTDEENAGKLHQTFNQVYRTGETAKAFDWEIIRKDGAKRFVEASVSLMMDPAGQPAGFRGILRDITERKRAEEALQQAHDTLEMRVQKRTADLQRANEALQVEITERKQATEELRAKEMQLIHAGRLSSLGEMATGVAHEINQPLAIISMAAEGRLRDIERDRFDINILPHELKDILKNVKRIDRIITHMRTFARTAGEWESVNPEEVLDNVFILLGEQFRIHGISVSREIAEGLPAIKVDSNQLEQVFVNILIDARQVLDEKAEESKRVGKAFEKRLACSISQEKQEEEEYVVFEFADNAYGVPDELKLRVLDPFLTTKEPGEGTGLGLSIAYSIVTHALGGKIWVEDNEMGGASFKVALPLGEVPCASTS